MSFYRIQKDGAVEDVATGELLRNGQRRARILARASKLHVPPAYTQVEVSKSTRHKVLACARDGKGRRQCLYNPDYVAQQQRRRFDKVARYDDTFRRIMRHVRRRVSTAPAQEHELQKQFQVCMVLHIMLLCNFRIGNERYAKENGSYGLTTLEWRHVHAKGDAVTIRFLGKKGVENVSVCKDPHVLRFVKSHRRGHNDTDRVFSVSSKDVNKWLGSFEPHAKITSKDLRTWQANRLYRQYARAEGDPREALKRVAQDLHHTTSVCRKNYIDPRILAAEEESIPKRGQIVATKKGSIHSPS